MRLLTCSNSGPQRHRTDDVVTFTPAPPGGLAPMLTALIDELGGRWIFTAPDDAAAEETTGRYQPLPIPDELISRQRESICIRTLLWLFHYLHDTAVAPTFDDGVRSAWLAYREVNRYFADALAQAHREDDYDVVLVHDFHLMLVPALFSAAVPDRSSRLVYFHHVPWCEPDYFGILPVSLRTHILESLLSCDVVAFHMQRWGDAFIACCDRYLAGADIVGRTVTYHGRPTTVTTAPGPVDAGVLDRLATDPATADWQETLRRRAAGRQVICRVDRLDLWKNVVRGFQAYQALLVRRPALAQDFWFCAVVTPPRLSTDRHRDYQARCDDAVDRVNAAFPVADGVASLIYPDASGGQRTRAVAALSLSSATLVNPTYDGLNLVAKESLLVNPAAPLLLSTNAGAYPQLAAAVIPVDPFDVTATADGLEQAIEGPRPDGPKAVDACVAQLRRETASGWLAAMLTGVES